MTQLTTMQRLLTKRLMEPGAFEVHIGTNAQRFFQAPLKAVHADCLELADGTFVMVSKIVTIGIIE